MEALYQGASTALMLVGIAALLAGIATLWRAIGWVRVERSHLALDEAADERATQQAESEAEANRQWKEVLQALVPTATALVGHWLGSQSGRHAREDEVPPGRPCRCHHARPPRGSPFERAMSPDGDDETQVELDVDSLLESVPESRFGQWLAGLVQQGTAPPTTFTPKPEADDVSASMA